MTGTIDAIKEQLNIYEGLTLRLLVVS